MKVYVASCLGKERLIKTHKTVQMMNNQAMKGLQCLIPNKMLWTLKTINTK